MKPQTTKKTILDIEPGDIIRVEYGAYGNYCNLVYVACQPYVKNTTQITVRYINDTETFAIYDLSPINKITFDVIGKEV